MVFDVIQGKVGATLAQSRETLERIFALEGHCIGILSRAERCFIPTLNLTYQIPLCGVKIDQRKEHGSGVKKKA